ncbi:MAG TPA: apolipoprotein N-acyltransferase [Planctomycetota bacterium]
MRALTALLCGLALALPFRDWHTSLPAWVALSPMFWLVKVVERRREALAYSAVFSLAWTAGAFWFLWPLAPPAMMALCIYVSLYYIAALLGVRWMARRSARPIFGIAALWVLLEMLRATVPVFGFPWLLLGHSLLYSEHLRQGADLLGVYGLSFLIVAVNAWVAFIFWPMWVSKDKDRRATTESMRVGSMLASLLLATFLYGELRIREIAPRLEAGPPIAVIQGNIREKLNRTYEQCEEQLRGHLEMHRQVAAQAKAGATETPELICWAETMVPGSMNVDDWGKEFKAQVAATGIPTLAGSNFAVSESNSADSGAPQFRNTLYLIDGHGNEIYHYSKRRLVAFGEYVPFTQDLPFMKLLRSITRDQYLSGLEPSKILTIPPDGKTREGSAPYHVGLSICVEDIHPDIARQSALAGADALLNVTNDGWFFDTCGPQAHLQAAAWRAIEVRRPLLRVTNTGRTVAVNPLGSMDLLLPEGASGTAVTRLWRYQPQAGVYGTTTLTMILGDLGAALVFCTVFLTSLWLSWRKSQVDGLKKIK